MKKSELLKKLNESLKSRQSHWRKTVIGDAIDIIDEIESEDIDCNAVYEHITNGATNVRESVYGGNFLVYDGDIAERYCTPSELRRRDHGRLPPNNRENWLDVQTRAIRSAYSKITSIIKIDNKGVIEYA